MKVYSKPGQTVFQVMLPLDLEHVNQDQIVITQEWINFDDSKLQSILKNNDNIAVVGITNNPDEASYDIPAFLQDKGYNIFPINPKIEGQILGRNVYQNLKEVSEKIDIVLIFSPDEELQPIIDEIIEQKISIVWMQEGVFNEDSARIAQKAGIEVVMDKCIRNTYNTLLPEFKK